MLKWLRSEGCLWNSDLTTTLEEESHIEALQWLIPLGHYSNEELRSLKKKLYMI